MANLDAAPVTAALLMPRDSTAAAPAVMAPQAGQPAGDPAATPVVANLVVVVQVGGTTVGPMTLAGVPPVGAPQVAILGPLPALVIPVAGLQGLETMVE